MTDKYKQIINNLVERLTISNTAMEDAAYNYDRKSINDLPHGIIESTNCSTQLLIEVRDNKKLLEDLQHEQED